MYIGVEQRIFIPERHRLTHSLQRRLAAHGGTQRAMELQRLTGAQQLDGDDVHGVFYRLKRFTCGGNPHADMIFLTGAGGYRVDTGRAGQTAVIARQRSGDVGWDHHPGVPRIRRDKKGRQPAEMRIGYSVATGLGSGAQLGNRNGQRIQRQRRWRTVTVAPWHHDKPVFFNQKQDRKSVV